jgi:hypothetical protein
VRSLRWAAAPAIGATFGALDSTVNALSSSWTTAEPGGDGTPWGSVLRFASFVLDAGWAWAALAVAVGWMATGRVRAAVAGAGALVAATLAYYLADSFHRAEPLATYLPELGLWCAAGLALGSVLGLVGAAGRRPGPAGFLARLTVPAGAAVQMAVAAPGLSGRAVPVEAVWARSVVWVAAATSAALVLARSSRQQHSGQPR